MSEEAVSSKFEMGAPAASQPDESHDGPAVGSSQEEGRVVHKLDLNLMTLFFFLCEYISTRGDFPPLPSGSARHYTNLE